jgi:integrase
MGKFTAIEIRKLTVPGRYGDGDGLYFQVRDAERRSWLLRYRFNGKARAMGLGEYPLIGLADARDKAETARRLLKAGIDPIDQKHATRAQAKADAVAGTTFRETATLYIAAHEATWRNAKHRSQWRNTLETYCYPTFGDLPVKAIETAHVMKALEAIWHTKPETASRVRGRVEAILDYATARGWRSGDNPARWRGHVANLLPRRSKVRAVVHHAALPWKDIAAFMVALRDHQAMAARALEFTILTAARTGETMGARWSEIDLGAKVWTVPAERMKAGREHRVPLSKGALAVLESVAPMADSPDAYVFPSPARPSGKRPQNPHNPQNAGGRPLSNMAFTMLLRRMKRDDVTPHGFRSAFRDWCSEATSYSREVAEAALAHTVGDRVEAAYRRGDLFQKRAALMDAWGAFCAKPVTAGAVVPITRQRRQA